MKKELEEKFKQAIERKDEIISLDKDTYETIYKIKNTDDGKWKIAIPILAVTIGAAVAVTVPDPLEAFEVAAVAGGITSLAAIFGPKVGKIVNMAKTTGMNSMGILRTDYLLKQSGDNFYLKRKESIKASQLEFPPSVYISNKLKFDEYDDDSNIASLTKGCASEWKRLKSITIRGSNDFEYCKNGTIFIKHPFLPKTYMELAAALDPNEIMHEKMVCVSSIIHDLGAKKLSGKAHFIREETVNIKNSTDIKTPVKITAKVEKNKNASLDKQFSFIQTGSGGFSEESYNRAKQRASEFGLDSDIDIKTLFQKRDPSNCNICTSFEMTYELTKEINKTLDIAIDLVKNGYGINNDYKSKIQKREVINYTMNIEF